MVFRAKSPAIVGCEIISGLLKPKSRVFKLGNPSVSGTIKQLQMNGEPVKEAKEGDRVAISIEGQLNFGRNAKEGDVFITDLTGEEYKTLRKYEDVLSPSEKSVLSEIVQLKRAENRLWGL